MIKNYILIAVRNMWKRKTFTLIHILGLSIAFGVALLLFATAMFELSFDSFHTNKEHIYQVYRQENRPGGAENDSPMPVPFGPAAVSELKGIRYLSRMGNSGVVVRYGDKTLESGVRHVDADFLKMFSFRVVNGNSGNALGKTDEVVITRSYAENLFGSAQAAGKIIEMQTGQQWKSYMVSAVVDDPPKNSSITFNILSRFENFPGYAGNEDKWTNQNHPVFLQLHETVGAASFERSARSFVNKHFAEKIKTLKRDGARPDANGQYFNLKLIPLEKIHFSTISGTGPTINPFFPWILIFLSGVVLFIAGSNFVNLSLAASFTRAREIGVRKTFGAMKTQLIIQFWSEAFLICLISLLLGTGLLLTGMKSYAAVSGTTITAGMLLSPRAIMLFAVIFLSTTLLAGGYPSWVMARLNTVRTLQGKLSISPGNRLRDVLVIVQFFVAIVLIISTLTIVKQLAYIRNKPLGFNKTEVISIPVGNNIEPETALRQMRNRLASFTNVLSVTGTDINLGIGLDGSSSTSILGFDYKDREIKTNWLRIDYDYLKTLDIQLTAGRDFSRNYGTDTASTLINEQMAAALGEKEPVGILLPIGDGQNLKVIGVVKDFHFKNLHQEIRPLTMVIRPHEMPVAYIFVKVKPDNLPASMNFIKKTWKEVNPQGTQEPSFLDENTGNQYKKEDRLAKTFTAGAGLAIFISCMGLFASALLAMNQRTKEIGIRKVLGAGTAGLVALLSRDFARQVGFAFVAAAPLGWFIMNRWLDDFAYRIELSGWIVLSGGLIALAVALATVSVHVIRAALANPVKSLKTE